MFGDKCDDGSGVEVDDKKELGCQGMDLGILYTINSAEFPICEWLLK